MALNKPHRTFIRHADTLAKALGRDKFVLAHARTQNIYGDDNGPQAQHKIGQKVRAQWEI